jgi:hypothetical protein
MKALLKRLLYLPMHLLISVQQLDASCAAGCELTEERFGCLGLGLELYQGDSGLTHRADLTISSLVDISSPG